MADVYLADTQIVIWSLISPHKLTASVQQVLQSSHVKVSEISLFEIAIKQKIGRLPNLSLSAAELASQLLVDGFELLPIHRRHIEAYDDIPLWNDHRDPFDRLLLATALVEEIPLISADEQFKKYKPLIQLLET